MLMLVNWSKTAYLLTNMYIKNHRAQCKTNGVNLCLLINNRSMHKIIMK